MNEFERNHRLAESIRPQYPKGTRLLLIGMDDPYSPIQSGTRGTVDYVDDQAQIHMKWDNGRTLVVIPNVDSFRKLTEEELAEERKAAATRSDFKKYIVCLDSNDENFTAFDSGKKWNGWECPLFTKEIGLKICEAMQHTNTKLSYSAEKDCFVANYTDDDITSEYEGSDYVVDDELVRLYPIGSAEWVWCKSRVNLDEAEEEENNAICVEETTEELVEEGFQQFM